MLVFLFSLIVCVAERGDGVHSVSLLPGHFQRANGGPEGGGGTKRRPAQTVSTSPVRHRETAQSHTGVGGHGEILRQGKARRHQRSVLGSGLEYVEVDRSTMKGFMAKHGAAYRR